MPGACPLRRPICIGIKTIMHSGWRVSREFEIICAHHFSKVASPIPQVSLRSAGPGIRRYNRALSPVEIFVLAGSP
jgi:hypothetical protein